MVSQVVLIEEVMKKYQIVRNDFSIERKEPIFEFQLDEPEMDKLIIEEIDKVGDQQGHRTNAQCLMTYWQMWEYPGFKRFAKMFLDACDAVSRMQFDIRHKYQFVLKNLWGLKYTSGQITKPHDHWPAVYSCSYYITAPEGAPGLYFPEIKTKEGFGVEKKIKPGMLLIFPSMLRHEVREQPFEGYRYTVSSNAYVDYKS